MTEFTNTAHTEPVVVNYEPVWPVETTIGYGIEDGQVVGHPEGKVIEPPVLSRPVKGRQRATSKRVAAPQREAEGNDESDERASKR